MHTYFDLDHKFDTCRGIKHFTCFYLLASLVVAAAAVVLVLSLSRALSYLRLVAVATFASTSNGFFKK